MWHSFSSKKNCLLVSWVQSPSTVILEPRKIKSVTVSPSICHGLRGPDIMILFFWMLNFKLLSFSLSSYTFIKMLLSSSLLAAIWLMSSAYLRLSSHIISYHHISPLWLHIYTFLSLNIPIFLQTSHRLLEDLSFVSSRSQIFSLTSSNSSLTALM